MSERIFEFQERPEGGFSLHFRPPKVHILPKEARAHFLAAQKELLLGLRSLVEAAVERSEQEETPRTATKIDVT